MRTGDKPRLVPFKAKHLKYLEVKEPHAPDIIPKLGRYFSNSGIAFTARVKDGYVGAAGVIPIRPGMAHAWLIPGPLFKRHLRWVIRELRTHLEWIMNVLEVPVIETMARPGMYSRLVEMLGFEHLYTLGEYRMYVRKK